MLPREKSGRAPSVPWATGTQLQEEASAWFPLQTKAKREKLHGSENQSDGEKQEPLEGLLPQKVHLRHDAWHRNRHRQDGRGQELFQRRKWEQQQEKVWEEAEPSETHME